MNSIKTVKGLLSQDFTIKAFDEKDSDYWSESQKDSNFKIKQTKAFDGKESKESLDSQNGKESKESLDSQKGSNYKRKQTKAFDEKESEECSDSFSLVHRKDNGYSVTEDSKL